MAEGAWQAATNIMAQQANMNRGKNDKIIQPQELNPYIESKPESKGIPLTADSIGMLKCLVK